MKKNKLYIALTFCALTIGAAGWMMGSASTTTLTQPDPTSSTTLLASAQTSQNTTVELKDAQGNPVNFSDFEGKIVFVNNWATWCRPCTMEMPSIQKLKDHFKGEDLAFVMISYDRNPQTSIQWMSRQGYSLPVYIKGKDLPRTFVTRGIPATFILDKKGEMIFRHVGMNDYGSADFVSKMETWLAE